MRKSTATRPRTSRRARAARAARGSGHPASPAASVPELLPVQVLRDLLVEAWMGAIADGSQPVLAQAPRSPRGARGRARSRSAAAPAARQPPIRDRILAEIERQRGAPARRPGRARRRL